MCTSLSTNKVCSTYDTKKVCSKYNILFLVLGTTVCNSSKKQHYYMQFHSNPPHLGVCPLQQWHQEGIR